MSPKKVEQTLKFMLANQAVTGLVPFLWGAPGLGKSAVVKKCAKDLEADLIDMRLSEHDASEIKGIDMPDEKTKTLHRFLPQFCDRIKENDKQNRRTILFFDEAMSGHPSTQPPLYKITLDRSIGDYKLPDNVGVVLASNREEDRAIVNRMSSALGNRLAHINFELSIDDLTEWAVQNKTHTQILAFWRFRPEQVHRFDEHSKSWPSPRSWDRVNHLLHSGLDHDTEFEAMKGIIGEGTAGEFAAFLSVYRDLPTFEQIMKKPLDVPIPHEMSACYALTLSLAERASKTVMDTLCKYVTRMQVEFQVLFMRHALLMNRSCAEATEFHNWAVKNSNFLVS